MKEIKERVKNLKNNNYKKIMYRLINIYENECRFCEGDLGYTDLYDILTILESEQYEYDEN